MMSMRMMMMVRVVVMMMMARNETYRPFRIAMMWTSRARRSTGLLAVPLKRAQAQGHRLVGRIKMTILCSEVQRVAPSAASAPADVLGLAAVAHEATMPKLRDRVVHCARLRTA